MKHVVVTGGARGIGKAIVEELASNGYEVTATYHDSQKVAEEITAKYPSVTYKHVDLEDRKELDKLIKELSTKPIDIIINNAGVYVGKRFTKMTEAELYRQVDLNFAAPARLIQGLVPALEKSKTPIVVNISSQSTTGKLTGEAMYSAVKAALSTLADVLRAELNQKGIRFVTFEPFGVNTYGVPEPSNMILPKDLAQIVRQAIEVPDHIQLDTIRVSHIKQDRPDFPEWVEK